MATTALAHRPKVTHDMLAAIKSSAEKAMKHAGKIREKSEGIIETAVRSGEIFAVSMGLGYLQGRYGKEGGVTFLKMPVELATAIGGHAIGFLGLFGKYSDHGHNAGDAGLGVYASTLGRGLGKNAAKKAGESSTSGDKEDGRRGATASRSDLRNYGRRRAA